MILTLLHLKTILFKKKKKTEYIKCMEIIKTLPLKNIISDQFLIYNPI